MIAYVLAGVLAGVVAMLGTTLLWLHSVIRESNHLRDLITDSTARETTLHEDNAALEIDVARLTPALATSERLLIAANATITRLQDAEVTEDNHEIDQIPTSDLVARSHELLQAAAAGAVAAEGDHNRADPVSHPDPAGER